MSQFIVETRVKSGHIEVDNIPFSDETDVRIIVIPKVDLTKMSFPKIRNLTKSIKGNISDDIEAERNER